MPKPNRLSVEFIGRLRLVPGATDPRAGRFRAHRHRPWREPIDLTSLPVTDTPASPARSTGPARCKVGRAPLTHCNY